VTDGRSAREAGLTLTALARFMAALGCRDALNLDAGGSAALVCGGRLQNVPRCDAEVLEPGGRPLATAVTFAPA
jgi:exopolysaccharide biosynthesis protein